MVEKYKKWWNSRTKCVCGFRVCARPRKDDTRRLNEHRETCPEWDTAHRVRRCLHKGCETHVDEQGQRCHEHNSWKGMRKA